MFDGRCQHLGLECGRHVGGAPDWPRLRRPVTSIDKARLTREREIHDAIARVLFKDWDPMGIHHVPEARHEYDGYVPAIYGLLLGGASPHEVAEHLSRAEGAWLGVVPLVDQFLPVAEKLCAIDCRIERT